MCQDYFVKEHSYWCNKYNYKRQWRVDSNRDYLQLDRLSIGLHLYKLYHYGTETTGPQFVLVIIFQNVARVCNSVGSDNSNFVTWSSISISTHSGHKCTVIAVRLFSKDGSCDSQWAILTAFTYA
jgi:hypothetical protein